MTGLASALDMFSLRGISLMWLRLAAPFLLAFPVQWLWPIMLSHPITYTEALMMVIGVRLSWGIGKKIGKWRKRKE